MHTYVNEILNKFKKLRLLRAGLCERKMFSLKSLVVHIRSQSLKVLKQVIDLEE